MKLHSPEFEKTVRRGVKKSVRRSRELKREFRAANRYLKHYSAASFVRLLISFALGGVAWQVAATTGHAASALAVVTLWTFLFMSIHVQRLRTCLYAATDLPILLLLPVSGPVIFRWELQRFLRGSLMSLADVVAGYGGLAVFLEFSGWKWAGVLVIAALTWVTLLALTALCAARLPRVPYQFVSIGFVLTVVILFAAHSIIGKAVVAVLDRSAVGVNLLLPTGWPGSLFQLLVPGGDWLTLGLLLPTGALLCTIKNSLTRFRMKYEFKEVIWAEPSDLVPGADAEERHAAAEAEPEKPMRLGPTAIEEIVQLRQFLVAPQWHQTGWFEKLLWNWLSEREKVLTEFVFPKGFAIGAPWKKIGRNLAVALLAVMAIGSLFPALKLWVLGIGLFVTGSHALSRILDSGRAFQSLQCSGVLMPLYAGYPVGFRELARLLSKCSWVQVPLLIPFIIMCSMALLYLGDLPIGSGIVFGVKAGLLLSAARFIFLTFSFSAGTNDSSGFRFRTLVLLVLIVGSGLLFLLFGGASLFVPDQRAAWILLVLAMLDAYALFRIYGWFYQANCFDLMSIRRQ